MIKYTMLIPRVVLFAERIPWWLAFSCLDYDLYFGKLPSFRFFLKIDESYTKTIDLLTLDTTDIQSIMSASTVKKNRRAKNRQAYIRVFDDVDTFIELYNDFAHKRGLDPLTFDLLNHVPLHNRTMLAVYTPEHDHALVVICYFHDETRVREIYQATCLQSEDSLVRNGLSELSLFLRYEGMLYFKTMGKEIYDLGGYVPDTSCPKLNGINQFKDSFKGNLVKGYHIRSYFIYLLKKWLIVLRSMIKL